MATIPGVMFIPHGHEAAQIPDGDWIALANHSYDTIFGGEGNDTIFATGSHDVIVGGQGNDLIIGTGDHDLLIGGEGNDTIFGGGSHDTIIGGVGNQLLDGRGTADLITAGQGNDTMIGGGSHDTFVFGSGGGRDVVMDFHQGDVLQIQQNINGLHVTTAADLASRIGNDGHGNAVIDLGHGDSVTLVGINPQELHHDLGSFVKIQ
jgi:Ca2+-binding RTX toxin-like protein